MRNEELMGAVWPSKLVYGGVARWLGAAYCAVFANLRLFLLISIPTAAASDSMTDFYHQKTDDELRFFVEHPEHYQPSLVEAARRELRRRGVLQPVPMEPVVTTSFAAPAEAPARWGTGVALGLLLLVLGGGTYYLKQRDDTATAAATQAREDARRHQPPPSLTAVATSAIPNYDGVVAAAVAQQLRPLPAAEKANAPHLRQFRELAKRFWAAETQTEYLTNQATDGKAGPNFADQALVVRETWRAWNHAAVYTYEFDPAMKAQLVRMNEAASHQQHILDVLPGLLPGRKFLTDNETAGRTADVQDLVGGLLPVSPVSGRRYKRTVLKAKRLY